MNPLKVGVSLAPHNSSSEVDNSSAVNADSYAVSSIVPLPQCISQVRVAIASIGELDKTSTLPYLREATHPRSCPVL